MNTNPHQDALRERWTLEGTIPLSGVADDAAWHRARSVATGERVTLFVVGGPTALEAADTVRRAFLVEDPRLVPVREVVVLDDQPGTSGVEGHPLTVVEYPAPPAPPLAALLSKGPLHPETARSIIGEAATGLEVARRRGLRHQFIDSNRIFVDVRSGAVAVLGVGAEAAAHPDLDRSREVASLQDATALVALLYRALTGRSPQPDSSGRVPSAASLAPGEVPADLDLLCDLMLNGSTHDTPDTTRSLIEALGPWQSIPVTIEAYGHAAGAAPAAVPVHGAGVPPTPTAASGAHESPAEPAVSEAPAPAVPEASPPPVASAPEETDDPGLESTVQMDAVPDEDTLPPTTRPTPPSPAPETAVDDTDTALRPAVRDPDDDLDADLEDTVIRSTDDQDPAVAPAEPTTAPDPAAAAGVAGAAGAVSAVPAVSDAATSSGSTDSASDEPAPDRADSSAEAAPSTATTSSAARSAEDAQAIVRDLHLDERRATSAFPGHLDIDHPEPDAAAETAVVPGSPDPAPGRPGAAAAGGIMVAGGAVASAPGAAQTVGGPTGPAPGRPPGDPVIPDRTPGTRWPLATGNARVSDQPLSPPPGEAASTPPVIEAQPTAAQEGSADDAGETGSSPVPEARSAATPATAVHHGGTSTSPTPVVVAGRTESLAAAPEDGPIIVPGRDQSRASTFPGADGQSGSRSSLLRDVVNVAVDSDDPGTFSMGPSRPADRSRQSQWILILGVLLVIVALVFAISTITSGLRERVSNPLGTTPPAAAPAEEEQEQETTEDEEEPAEEETEELPAAALSDVEIFARGSDNPPDNTDQTARITDDDPDSFWSTQIYTTADYGRLKDGVGVHIDLEEPSTLSAVVVTTARNSGGSIELREVDEDGELGDVLDSGEFAGDGEVRLEPDEPVEAEAVALWFPDLPPDSEREGFRGRIVEVQVE